MADQEITELYKKVDRMIDSTTFEVLGKPVLALSIITVAALLTHCFQPPHQPRHPAAVTEAKDSPTP